MSEICMFLANLTIKVAITLKQHSLTSIRLLISIVTGQDSAIGHGDAKITDVPNNKSFLDSLTK